MPSLFPALARRRVMLAAAGLWLSTAFGAAQAAEPLPVVASFSILGDIVQEVGGADIKVSTLVGPDGDAHEYEPTPADAKKLAAAKVLFVNGLDFEAWLPRLVKASGFAGPTVVASKGVTPRKFAGHGDEHGDKHDDKDHDHGHAHDHGGHHHHDADPHAWQNLANGVIYARNVADGLSCRRSGPCRCLPQARRCLHRPRAGGGCGRAQDLRGDSGGAPQGGHLA